MGLFEHGRVVAAYLDHLVSVAEETSPSVERLLISGGSNHQGGAVIGSRLIMPHGFEQ